MLMLIIYMLFFYLYIISILTLALLVQGVIYWVTGFSVYNWLCKKIF